MMLKCCSGDPGDFSVQVFWQCRPT